MNEPAAGLEDAASGLWSSIERRWNAGMDVIDRIQRRRKPTAFVVGVLKRFAEDRGVQLGALIAYYGLLSIFPLMVVLLTVAGFVFDSRPDLRADLERTVLQQFPTMGPTIRQNTQAIRGNFVSLVLGLAGAVWAGLAAVNAAEVALNGIYNVARHERPNPIKRRLKSLRMLLILGLGVLASVMVANLGRVVDGLGGLQAVWLACASIGINTALYALAYRSLVSADLSWRSVAPGAALAGSVWWLLTTVGGIYTERTLASASATYGAVASAIALLAWIYLQAQVTLIGAEVNVVLRRRWWPRSLTGRDLTTADREAMRLHLHSEKLHESMQLDVDFGQ